MTTSKHSSSKKNDSNQTKNFRNQTNNGHDFSCSGKKDKASKPKILPGLLMSLGIALCSPQPMLAQEDRTEIVGNRNSEADHKEYRAISQMLEKARRQESMGELQDALETWKKIITRVEEEYGTEHLDTASSLERAGLISSRLGRYKEAEDLHKKALGIRTRILGSNHPNTFISLNNLGLLYYQEGKNKEAERLFEKVQSALEDKLGPDHPDVATVLSNLGLTKRAQGELITADSLFSRSLLIRREKLEKNHRDTLTSISNLSLSKFDLGQYDNAETLASEALSGLEGQTGGNNPDLALILNNLGLIRIYRGKYKLAEASLKRAFSITKASLGPDHLQAATVLLNLGQSSLSMGDYKKAQEYVEEALSIRRRVQGETHHEYIRDLTTLGDILRQQGRYTESEALLRKAMNANGESIEIQISKSAAQIILGEMYAMQGDYEKAEDFLSKGLLRLEKIFGRDNIEVVNRFSSLGLLYGKQGRGEKALELFIRNLQIAEKRLGQQNPALSVHLSNLGMQYAQLGEIEKSKSLLIRAEEITEGQLSESHPVRATILNNLGWTYISEGQYDKAKEVLGKAITRTEQVHGRDYPGLDIFLNNYALASSGEGDHAKAEEMLTRAISLAEKNSIEGSPKLQQMRENLALAYIDSGRPGLALPLLRKSRFGIQKWLFKQLPFLPAEERLGQLDKTGSTPDLVFWLAATNKDAITLGAEVRLNRQGLLSELERLQNRLLTSRDTYKEKVESLRAYSGKMASADLSREERMNLQRLIEGLQAEIYRELGYTQISATTIEKIAQNLPQDGALVEFQQYRPYVAHKDIGKRLGDAEYLAFIITRDRSVSLVELGKAQEIDLRILSSLTATSEVHNDSSLQLERLSEQIITPLLPYLKGINQLFLSPDGELSRVPFNALPLPQAPDKLLSDTKQLRLVTTGRDLIQLTNPSSESSQSVVVFNPSFGDRSLNHLQRPLLANQSKENQERSSQREQTFWSQLPATEHEGRQVGKLLDAKVVSGNNATTKALNTLSSPKILHLATHGFFVQGERESANSDSPLQDYFFKSINRRDNPLLRSGIVLAGANEEAADREDDGYLTAVEAASLDLRGTELVVVSACSSGRGKEKTGEGVYGLQRSLAVAGTRSTLLSLWKVDDSATAEFMKLFYQRLKDGQSRSDALAATQRDFRRGTVGNGQWTEPYYWAAWQLVGDWRPIKGL